LDDNIDLYHMLELTEDAVDDKDGFRRHRIAVLGAGVFIET
jgi:hypothetical protein